VMMKGGVNTTQRLFPPRYITRQSWQSGEKTPIDNLRVH
jgi:hypothetical protein